MEQPVPNTRDVLPGRQHAGAFIAPPVLYVAEPLLNQDDYFGLGESWSVLRRRKGIVIVSPLAGLLVLLLFCFVQTPTYRATALIEVQSRNGNFLNSKEVTPVDESGPSLEVNEIQSQIDILTSHTVIARAIVKMDKSFGDASAGSSWSPNLQATLLRSSAPAKVVPETVNRLAHRVKAKPTGETRNIEVSFDYPDAQVAARFVNALADEYIAANNEARWQASLQTGQWLSRQLEDMRSRLQESEGRLQAYAASAGMLLIDEKYTIAQEKLRLVQEELSRAQAERAAREARYEVTRSTPPDSLADVLNDTHLRDYQAKLTDLRQQQALLAVPYSPEHPKLKEVAAQIATLEQAVGSDRANILKRIASDYQEALDHEKLAAESYNSQVELVNEQNEKAVQYTLLRQEVETNRQIYDGMLQLTKDSMLAAAGNASNIRIIDPAEPPSLPIKPSVLLYGALGLFLGAFLGVSGAFVVERRDSSFRKPGEAQLYLNLPELGAVPLARFPRRWKPRKGEGLSHLRIRLNERNDGHATVPHSAYKLASECIELATAQPGPSPIADSFRAILSSLLFSEHNGAPSRVLAITSANPKEGKSTVASNLAIALARIGRKVLLIDADLRTPRMDEVFHLSNERGITNLIDGTGPAGEAIVNIAALPGLFVLPSGTSTAAPGDLLHSKKLRELVGTLRNAYDYILIDTPPMQQVPDARVIAGLADSTVLVVRAGHTPREAALATHRRLEDDRTKVVGVILNEWSGNSTYCGYVR